MRTCRVSRAMAASDIQVSKVTSCDGVGTVGDTTDDRGRASLSHFLRHHSSLRDMIRYCRVLPHMSSCFGRSLYERKSRHSRKERAAPRWRDPRFSRHESEYLHGLHAWICATVL